MLESGETFAGYEIKRVLGRGGMGTVYLAKHPRLPRLTALKLLARELYTDAEIRGRFEREADLVAQLDHPNIVTVYDRGAEDDQLWISMQFISGSDAASVDVDVLAPARAVQIVAEVGAALDFAHANGVLHRDIKPANILLAKAPIGHPERVLLTDFGIAGVRDSDTTLASGDTITATLAYAAPEQLGGRVLDHRADQYSLGCTLYWLLTGSAPFPNANPAKVMHDHLYTPPPSVRAARPALPPQLDAVLARAMAKSPVDRFDSCTEFAAAARQALTIARPPTVPPQHSFYGPRPAGYPPGAAPVAPGHPAPRPGTSGYPVAPPGSNAAYPTVPPPYPGTRPYPAADQPPPATNGPYPPGDGRYPAARGGYPVAPPSGAAGQYPAPGFRPGVDPARPASAPPPPASTPYPGAGPTYPGSSPSHPGTSSSYPWAGPSYPASNPAHPRASSSYPETSAPSRGASAYPGADSPYAASNPSFPAADQPYPPNGYPRTSPSGPAGPRHGSPPTAGSPPPTGAQSLPGHPHAAGHPQLTGHPARSSPRQPVAPGSPPTTPFPASPGAVDLSRPYRQEAAAPESGPAVPPRPPTAPPHPAQPPVIASPASNRPPSGPSARATGRSPRPIVIALPDRVRRGRPAPAGNGGASGSAEGADRPPP